MYKLSQNSFGQTVIIKTVENTQTSFLTDEVNSDYQAYLAWIAEGNTPTPADTGETL